MTGVGADSERMLRDIRYEIDETRHLIGRERFSPEVMTALEKVPRHAFVAEEWLAHAYDNRPLPIGYGQTISQPYIVALMTELAGVDSDSRVLEIGTGSGYQAAILAELAAEVYTIEIIPELAAAAKQVLENQGYGNIHPRQGDGYLGWPECAPYDAVLVTAAAPEIPPPLIAQLKPGGRLVIPVGEAWYGQELMLLRKNSAGQVSKSEVLGVMFVPLTRAC